jgi:hypothetical protein
VRNPYNRRAVGAIPELVDENTGVLIPPGDAHALVVAMIDLPDETTRLAGRGLAARKRSRTLRLGQHREARAWRVQPTNLNVERPVRISPRAYVGGRSCQMLLLICARFRSTRRGASNQTTTFLEVPSALQHHRAEKENH